MAQRDNTVTHRDGRERGKREVEKGEEGKKRRGKQVGG